MKVMQSNLFLVNTKSQVENKEDYFYQIGLSSKGCNYDVVENIKIGDEVITTNKKGNLQFKYLVTKIINDNGHIYLYGTMLLNYSNERLNISYTKFFADNDVTGSRIKSYVWTTGFNAARIHKKLI